MRLYPKMNDNTKQVRVDNWGIFFLQRLQTFYSKTDFCDMTLQFEGNVQLKVHRLVMNACTEYFQYLEQTCTLEENVIMMPSDLQADVIVPIVNFMYTGMLEFHFQFFDKLYKAAQLMNITILTKLLDAQKHPGTPAAKPIKRRVDSPMVHNVTEKKKTTKSVLSDLPSPLPGRKLPVWKRKNIAPSQSHVIQLCEKWNQPLDPLSVPDNTPKPTRFEWPDEDLPPLNLMDTSFEDISYTSKPLLTQEEEHRASTSFDDLKHIPNANRLAVSSKKSSTSNLDMEEMKDYVKEQKIRSGLSHDDESIDNDLDMSHIESGQKRKSDHKPKIISKKIRMDEQEVKTTISIATDSKNSNDLNHEKIVSELLKKYPQLVKKNKNIKLKIMAKNKTTTIESNKPKLKAQVAEVSKPETKSTKNFELDTKTDKPWVCERCSTDEDTVEFVLYYLYRKHMTDVHSEKFDPKLCKYCGHRCSKLNLLMYHLYTKHGMKPTGGYFFPKCDQCPYIALSPNVLNNHKMRHTTGEIQCVECKLAFTSSLTLTSHMQITGHTGKSNKNSYDCQYCTKKFNSAMNLFWHLRVQHRNEAIRDGIVSIDEPDEVDEDEEEEDTKDEYILPEIIAEPETPKKVNILSNVKVQDRHEVHSRHQQLALEPSSEAEALNNVASGIATSLGLVEYVVLNDNQQLFLQSNQPNFSNNQSEQPEFILPELTGRESFTQEQNDVMTGDGVITQSMLSSDDIASTDELVMVLTDHDYGDNQEEINSDNSNIVVLYSHPVDGQQDQYITSQGNIMVNSQTGMIEIRNGATITSTANQVVMNPQETHIESIEMIQREIESHTELKQEALYEEEIKPAIAVAVTEPDQSEKPQEKETSDQQKEISSDPIIESLVQGDQLEFTTAPSETPMEQDEAEDVTEVHNENVQDEMPENINETPMDLDGEVNKLVDENLSQGECLQSKESEEEEVENISEAEAVAEVNEPMETVLTEDITSLEEKQDDESPSKEEDLQETKHSEEIENVEIEAKIENVTEQTEQQPDQQPEEQQPAEDEEKTVEESLEISEEQVEENTEVSQDEKPESEVPHEMDIQVTESQDEAINEPTENVTTESIEDDDNEADKEEEENEAEEIAIDLKEEEEEEKEKNVESEHVEELSRSDTSTSQFNDENSQSSQSSQKKDATEPKVATKISILDDWEDTDSQTSDHNKDNNKNAGETVNKLMDDWEDEEEDESRKDDDDDE